jgi:hypothetical protein
MSGAGSRSFSSQAGGRTGSVAAERYLAAADEIVKSSIALAIKRLTEPFHLKAGAKQREQASDKDRSAHGRLQDVGVSSQIGKMPENNDSEQSAAKYKTEAAEK